MPSGDGSVMLFTFTVGQLDAPTYLPTNSEAEMIDSNVVALDLERHAGLVLALRTAQATDLILEKGSTQSDDLLDAFGLACHNLVTYTNKQEIT
jgi:hypothetical protein